MFSKIKRALWGDITGQEFKRFGMLSLTFLFLIGTYWLMRPLKDTLFMRIVGRSYIPYAKMLSVVILFPLIMLYSKLVDMVEKQKLFYILCTAYASLFIVVSILLKHPTIGMANTATSPDRMLGWLIYIGIESFGSMLPALFWSFVASNTDTASAKKGYGLIIFGAQIGSITGPLLATQAEFIGLPTLLTLVACGVLIVPILIKVFITMYPTAAEATVVNQKKTGMFEGLRLLLSRPYLMGILGVATLYEVIGTVVDYQMKFVVDESCKTPEQVARFLGWFGASANSLTLVFALLGTAYFIRRFGLTICLVLFPVCVGLVIVNIMTFPSLTTLFVGMIVIKGLSYALNNPCKEIMYIPTSKDAKFKAKSWIDSFGGRSSKAVGSGINAIFVNMADLLLYGSLISLGIVGIWIVIAMYVGKTNKKLVETGTVIS